MRTRVRSRGAGATARLETGTDIARARLRNQRLVGATFEDVGEAIAWFGAVQAQDYGGAKWALAQRMRKATTSAQLDAAFADGALLRTHVLRPTWHFVTPADIRWLQELTAPRVRKILTYYDGQLDIDAKLLAKSHKLLVKALRGGKHMTRAELGEALRAGGVAATGQRLGHIVSYAELNAELCSGALRGKQHTYALVDERAPGARTMAREEALAELAKRYFQSHGPATVHDFAWWSGLTVADAKAGVAALRSTLTGAELDGRIYWFVDAAGGSKPSVHLLPNYDEYIVAYKDRAAAMDTALDLSNLRGWDLSRAALANTVVVDGRIAGNWRRADAAKQVTIAMDVRARLDGPARPLLGAAIERYGKFLGVPVRLT